jgi:hypothetical protein
MADGKLCLNGCFTFKPLSEFYRNQRSPDGLMAICKDCERKRVQIYRHGLTSADKEAIASDQGGCAACGRTEPGGKGWVVDHDRTCCPGDQSCLKCRRGVLCQWCNSALGYAGDSPRILRQLADYLESDNRVTQLNAELVSSLCQLTSVERPVQVSHGRTDRTD